MTIYRTIASGVVALGIGPIAMPAATSAQSHPHMAAPAALPRATAHPAAFASASRTPAPQRVIGTSGSHVFRSHADELRISQGRDHRGFGFPGWWGYAPLPPGYEVQANPGPDEGSTYDHPVGEDVPNRPDHHPYCRTDEQKVPSGHGGERTINITRCY